MKAPASFVASVAILFTVLVGVSKADLTMVSIDTIPSGSGTAINDMDGSVGLPMANIEGRSDSIAYQITASFDVENVTTLRTNASMWVNAASDDDSSTFWQNIDAKAKAQSTLAAFGVVQNPGGFDSGIVEFWWTVEGSYDPDQNGSPDLDSNGDPIGTHLELELGDSPNVTVTKFNALTTLTAKNPAISELDVIREDHSLTDAGTLDEGVAGGPFLFTVPWTGTELVPVFFELDSQLDLTVETNNEEFGDFEAFGVLDFGNSATLEIVITDDMGISIDSASLQLTPVPEPSSFFAVGLLATILGCVAFCRRLFRKQ